MLALALTLASHTLPAVTAPPRVIEDAARATLLDADWLAVDPELARATDVRVHADKLGPRSILRATPVVDGIAVEGADRILILDERGLSHGKHFASLAPHGSFVVDEGPAIATACASVAGCLFTDATVEDLRGFAVKTWLGRSDGIHAAWKVRIPTLDLREMRDAYVDAETGALIGTRPTVSFLPAAQPTAANVLKNDQPSAARATSGFAGGSDTAAADLELVQLDDLALGSVGDHLKGNHFETFNCCKHFTCNDDPTGDATCIKDIPAGSATLPKDVATCAAETDVGACAGTACASNIDVEVPPNTLPGINFNLFANVAFCAELPRIVSKAAAGPSGEDGWFEVPVDNTRTPPGSDLVGKAAEEDAFAEVQVYHSSWVFFQHIRDELGDQTFCLGPDSMTCEADGTSTIDVGTGQPVHPFHVTTNVLFPALDFQALAAQVIAGHGRTAEDPVVISDYQRIPNAAFVPKLAGAPINIPPELAPLAAIFSRPFDSNVYFQGDRDFAYDGDVVHHEFTHGIVHKLNPDLAVNGVDDYGSNVESGALNEGWADFMSSSYAGNSSVGEYSSVGLAAAGETGLRDNDNDKKCPDDLIGEVHGDSEPWAGALWRTRDSLGGDAAKIAALDRAVLAGVALGQSDDTYATAGANLVTTITAEPTLGATVAATFQSELDTRHLSACDRVVSLSTLNDAGDDIVATVVPQMFQPGKSDLNLSNFAPSLFQFRVKVPPKSGGFTLSWSQSAGGLGLGGGTPATILVLSQEETNDTDRIHWTYEGNGGTLAVPNDESGAPINFDATSAVNKASIGAADANNQSAGSFTAALDSTCDARTFVVDILSPDSSAVMTNITVANTATTLDCAPAPKPVPKAAAPGCGCGSSTDGAALGAFALVLVAVRRRRRG